MDSRPAPVTEPLTPVNILQAADIAIVATDLDRRVVLCNAAAVSLFGWREQEATGRDITDLLFGADPSTVSRDLSQALQGCSAWRGEVRARRSDGEGLLAEITLSPWYDDTGALAGLVIVAIAGNAVENVVGVRLAAEGKADFAVSVILNSALQIAVALIPLLVIVSFWLGGEAFTLAIPPILAAALFLSALVVTVVTAPEPNGHLGLMMSTLASPVARIVRPVSSRAFSVITSSKTYCS